LYAAAGRVQFWRIRRLRQALVPEYGLAPVIVVAGDAYGIFHIEEIAEALGVLPAFRLRGRSATAP